MHNLFFSKQHDKYMHHYTFLIVMNHISVFLFKGTTLQKNGAVRNINWKSSPTKIQSYFPINNSRFYIRSYILRKHKTCFPSFSSCTFYQEQTDIIVWLVVFFLKIQSLKITLINKTLALSGIDKGHSTN